MTGLGANGVSSQTFNQCELDRFDDLLLVAANRTEFHVDTDRLGWSQKRRATGTHLRKGRSNVIPWNLQYFKLRRIVGKCANEVIVVIHVDTRVLRKTLLDGQHDQTRFAIHDIVFDEPGSTIREPLQRILPKRPAWH